MGALWQAPTVASGGRTSRHLSAAVVVAVGVALTGGLAWAARSAHEDNEDRLTQQRAVEAAAVLTASVSGLEAPLFISAELVEAGSSDPVLFQEVMGTQVGTDGRFVSASVWPAAADGPLAVVGDDPMLADQEAATIERFLGRAMAADGMAVLDLLDGDEPRLGFAASSPAGSGSVVYAEQALPADRTSSVREDSAFSDIDYALYLDTAERDDTLLLASTADLPLEGRTGEADTELGDAALRLVVSPTDDLGGGLLAALWWIVLTTGLLGTAVGASFTQRLARRREQAEHLAEENAGLYAEQRAAALTLQESLLPRRLPTLPDLETAVRYTPGVTGTEVGGDWYEVVDVGGRVVLVIGDVSGRGLAAASVTAAVRHSIRALALQGDSPEVILEKVNQPGATDLGEHFVTVLCGVLDRQAGTLAVASAGHPPPLLANGTDPAYVPVPVGPPIGASPGATYRLATHPVSRGTSILFFTDGVFERRGESLDVGLERLRSAAVEGGATADELLDVVDRAMADGAGHDDAAMLAVRWT